MNRLILLFVLCSGMVATQIYAQDAGSNPLSGLEQDSSGNYNPTIDEELERSHRQSNSRPERQERTRRTTEPESRVINHHTPGSIPRTTGTSTEIEFVEGDTVNGEISGPDLSMIIASQREDGLCEEERRIAYRYASEDTTNYTSRELSRYNNRYQDAQDELFACYQNISTPQEQEEEQEEFRPARSSLRGRVGVEVGASRSYVYTEGTYNHGVNAAVTGEFDYLRRNNFAIVLMGSVGADSAASSVNPVIRNWSARGVTYIPFHRSEEDLREGWNASFALHIDFTTRSDHWARVSRGLVGLCAVMSKTVNEGEAIPYIAICPLNGSQGWGIELEDGQRFSNGPAANSSLLMRNIGGVMNFDFASNFAQENQNAISQETTGSSSRYIARAYQIDMLTNFLVARLNSANIRVGARYHYSSYRNRQSVTDPVGGDFAVSVPVPATRNHQILGTFSLEF